MNEQGPGVTKWTPVMAIAQSPDAVVTTVAAASDDGKPTASHFQLLNSPKALATKLKGAAATLAATVARGINSDGALEITVEARTADGSAAADALYVTLTTSCEGRFSENAFHILGGEGKKVVSFFPWAGRGGCDDEETLQRTIRVEDMIGNLN